MGASRAACSAVHIPLLWVVSCDRCKVMGHEHRIAPEEVSAARMFQLTIAGLLTQTRPVFFERLRLRIA